MNPIVISLCEILELSGCRVMTPLEQTPFFALIMASALAVALLTWGIVMRVFTH